MFDLTLSMLVMRVLAALIIIGVHGFALAAAAKSFGDGQAGDRLSISPFGHVDLLGLLAFVLFGFGWILPVPMNFKRIRGGAWAVPLVLVAGLAPVLLLAALAVYLLPWASVSFSYSTAPMVVAFLGILARLSIGFVLLNLLPVPPFSLGQLLVACREDWRESAKRFHFAFAIIALLLGYAVQPWIAGAVDAVAHTFFGDISLLSRAR